MKEIDISRVPVDRRDDEFQSKYRRLQREIADPVMVKNICIHESGHWIYFKRAGIKNFTFAGPTIFIDEHGFQWFSAQVGARLQESNNIYALAKGAAAGGVFTDKIACQAYRGDATDFAVFKDILSPTHLAMTGETAEQLWEQGKLAVEHDLQVADDAFREEIEAAIARIGWKCFEELVWNEHN
jgi:hypothetical protein